MTDLEVYQPAGQIEQYQARMVMAPGDAKALDDQLRACTKAVLREGTDYGVIPGTDGKQHLLKAGAEKLLQWFGLSFTCDRVEIDHDAEGRKEGVTYRAVVTKQLGDGRIVAVATCEGYAGYDEDRFYQSAEQARAKAEAKERFFAEKDRRAANPNKWKWATEYKAPWNTVIKMAQKRAIAGATIDATAAAGLFTQEDEPAPAADSGGFRVTTPEDDDWPQGAAPRAQQPAKKQDDSQQGARPWYEIAIKAAADFKTEAAGNKLFREAAAKGRAGECTPDQATHVQNLVTARIDERRKEAMERLLAHLSEDDDWRDKVRDLDGVPAAREALEEIGQLEAAGVLNPTRAGRVAAAIRARHPKAALADPEATA